MVALLVLIGCGHDESEFDEQVDAAYAAGCDVGRVAGSIAGEDDGTECRERSLVPLEAARKGMVEYCGGKESDSDQPCYWWQIGYLDCWLAGYDMSYPVAWDAAGCQTDSGS